MTGDKETKGNTRYAGPVLNAWKSNNCPPQPNNPDMVAKIAGLKPRSNFHLIRLNAKIAPGIIVTAQTE